MRWHPGQLCITLRRLRRCLEAGETDLTKDNSASNITWFDCYDLNDRGRMEIDHVFASGAVVGRATSHEWGRPSLRAQPGDHTAPDAKTSSIPTLQNMSY